MAAVVACFCKQLASSLGGAPAACCLVSGKPAVPSCEKGFAWARLISAYPSVTFPQQMVTPQRCLIDTWGLKVEIGITRCAPAPCDQLSNACCDAEAKAAAILMDDFRAMRRVWTCGCLGIASDKLVVGDWAVYGPEGGCQGSTMKATILTTQ